MKFLPLHPTATFILVFFYDVTAFTARSCHPLHQNQCQGLRASAMGFDDYALKIDTMIGGMRSFYEEMVDDTGERFYGFCDPSRGQRKYHDNAIRDLAAVWDASKILLHTSGSPDRLGRTIASSIQLYSEKLETLPHNSDGAKIISSAALGESPNIAHSSMLTLAMIGARRLKLEPAGSTNDDVISLARGIMSMQRADGAFGIFFEQGGGDDNVYSGIDFFPGEAILALLEVDTWHQSVERKAETTLSYTIMKATESAFHFYSEYYRDQECDVNYNIWQVQAFSKLHGILRQKDDEAKGTLITAIGDYVCSMCQDISESNAWKYEMARGSSFYPNLSTVEIACGLDALADGVRVADFHKDPRMDRWILQMKNAIWFLEWAQQQVPKDAPIGYGGLGQGGVYVTEQRLDVTGHAVSALTKI